MKIVVDTNVVISGVFFGGFPRKILTAIVEGKFSAFATAEIIDEYEEITEEMINRKQGHLNSSILSPFVKVLQTIEPVSRVKICRDPDDDKFIVCAKDCAALYIVSGDKDLLVLKNHEDIKIVTAKEFCEQYL